MDVTKAFDTFFVVEPNKFLVTLNSLLVPSSLVVVSCWAMISIVIIFLMPLDVTTFGTSIPSRFGTIEVSTIRFIATLSLS